MQKLINRPADAVTESLQGLEFAHRDLLRVHYHPHFVYRIDAPVKNKVAIISGSGSGHEPLNSGYVGRGMLDAACPGEVFTSPTPEQYLAATNMVHGGAGALFVVKNHMGGVLNMEVAMELVSDEGIEVASVLIHDDVAVDNEANRRGLGAAILVEKIAGAAAEEGRPLHKVSEIACRVSEQTRSMGVALTGCTSPYVGHPTFNLRDHEVELGVGIHGERGKIRTHFDKADDIIDMLIRPVVADLHARSGDHVLVLVSGLGGTPQQELYIVYRYVHQFLTNHGIVVEQQLVGNYITSLEMAGCSVTILRLDPELLVLWNAPVRTPTLWW